MAKYDVTGTVTISTTIEPSGYLDESFGSEVEDFNFEGFSGYGQDIEAEAEVSFVLVTDSDDPEDEAEEILGNITYTGDDIEWEVVNTEVTSIERQQMDLDEAVEVVRTFLDSREEAFKTAHPAVYEALQVLLQQH